MVRFVPGSLDSGLWGGLEAGLPIYWITVALERPGDTAFGISSVINCMRRNGVKLLYLTKDKMWSYPSAIIIVAAAAAISI